MKNLNSHFRNLRFVLVLTLLLAFYPQEPAAGQQPPPDSAGVGRAQDLPIPREAERFEPPSRTYWDYLPRVVTDLFESKSRSEPIAAEHARVQDLSLLLDGKSGYLRVPNSSSLNFSTAAFTIEGWVKPSETETTQGVLEKYQPGVGGYSLSIQPKGEVRFSVVNTDATIQQNSISGNFPVEAGKWTHLAIVVINKRVSIYLNGILDAEGDLGVESATTHADLTIGLTHSSNEGNEFFNGLIDEIRLSNYAVYTTNFQPNRSLQGGGVAGLTAGSWRFTDGKLGDGSGNNNTALIVGRGVFFIGDEEYGSDDPSLTPASIISFDGSLATGSLIGNYYPDISFFDYFGYPMIAQFECTYSPALPMCPGQSYPNFATTPNNGRRPVIFTFAQPTNVAYFDVLGSDAPLGESVATVSIKQDGAFYSYYVYSNGYEPNTGFGSAVRLLINQTQCGGANIPCDHVTQISVHSITDDPGLGYDNFSYVLVAAPTPTPPPCVGESNGDEQVMPPCQPTPTPTPAVPNAPSNLVATNERGKVHLEWVWATTASNQNPVSIFRIERAAAANGPWSEVILQNGLPSQRSYDDKKYDIRIDQPRYYRVIAYNNAGASGPSNVASGAPLSACTIYDPYTLPSLPSDGTSFSAFGWSGRYKFEHGFSVLDVLLNGRMMAKHLGLPSVYISRGNASPNQTSAFIDLDLTTSQQNGYVSRPYAFSQSSSSERGRIGLNLDAKFCISSPSGQERWDIDVLYRFEQEKEGDMCEPSSGLSCSRFYPYVQFDYFNEGAPIVPPETAEITIVQRLHFKENGDANNVLALVRDCDNVENTMASLEPGECRASEFPVDFRETVNPLEEEIIGVGQTMYLSANGSQPPGKLDNFHQTGIDKVSMPGPLNNDDFSIAGCPSCIHDHWRWTAQWFTNASWGAWSQRGTFSGRPIVGPDFKAYGEPTRYAPGNFQAGLLNVCKYHQEEFENITGGLCGSDLPPSRERIFTKMRNSAATSVTDQGSDIVLWYNTLSVFNPVLRDGVQTYSDLAHAHGGFFQPVRSRNTEKMLSIELNPTVSQPTKLLVENYYKHPGFSSENINAIVDASSTASIPSRYTRVVGSEYRVSLPTSILVMNPFLYQKGSDISGTHVLTYKIPNNVTLEVFNKMRILHYERDFFTEAWIDRTILTGPDAPDFQNKTIKARVTSIGKFVIATLNQFFAPGLVAADLQLQGTVSPSNVNAGSNATYVFLVTNNGPNLASNVILAQTINRATRVVSATSSQGECHGGSESLHDVTSTNNLRCVIGAMPSGSTVTVTVVVNVSLFGDGTDTQPVELASWSDVSAEDSDSNDANNSVRLAFNAIPSTNKPPVVSIVSPLENAVFVASSDSPATISINISATDVDGTIQEVKVYDTGSLAGSASYSGGNNYAYSLTTGRYGYHTIRAIAKDNTGRTGSSIDTRILVNSPHSISIISPTQAQFFPGSTISVQTNSTLVGSRVQKIELFANGDLLGKLRAVSNTGNLYNHQLNWQNVPRGRYELTAVLTDLSGETTISAPKTVVVSNPPTVSITSPTDAAVFPSSTSIAITAQVADVDGFVLRTEFFASGALIDTKNERISSGSTSTRWVNPSDGIYSLVAVVTDDLGLQASSAPVNIGINRPSPSIGELIWMDDNVPTGATSGGDDGWNWTNTNPNSLVGNVCHQSLLKEGQHEHFFEGSVFKLSVTTGEKLSAWIFLDPDFPPGEIMLQWKNQDGWEHRAYWGQNLINLGTDGTNSRRYIGALPSGTGWKQLNVPANLVGLEGSLVNGMKFTLHGGRASWDRVGKLLASAPEPGPPQPDFVWNNDSPPSGSILEAVHDSWSVAWISNNPSPYNGTLSHKHWDTDTNEPFRQHSFKNATNAMSVDAGDTLFTYVYLNPDIQYQPDTLMLQWHDTTSGWDHRAYWGKDFSWNVSGFSVRGTNIEGWRYMGPIPARGSWIRLEIPASYVGLEGKSVTGMAFSVYQKNKKGRAAWDYSGKTSAPPQNPSAIPALKFTTPLYRFSCGTGSGQRLRYYQNKDFDYFSGCSAGVNIGYTYPTNAPGTRPLYLFEYTQNNWFRWRVDLCESCQIGWEPRGITAYVPSLPTTATVVQVRFSCNNNDFQTTWPDLPDNIYPTNCTPDPHVPIYVHSR